VIAFGHPLGCTGAKLTATALYELRRRGGRDAMVTMGICGCQCAAGLFEAIRPVSPRFSPWRMRVL
jgi:acetyl-CoA acyltransferase